MFSFVFGDPDPNQGYDGTLTRYALAYLRGHRGVMTLEEVMAMTGREPDEAQRLLNRWVLEFEGDPRATDEGTVVYAFPELLRTTAAEQQAFTAAPHAAAPARTPVPFSTNKPRANGWIIFLNSFNLAFGGYFLFTSLAPQSAAQVGPNFAYVSRIAGALLEYVGIANPTPVLVVGLGLVPLVFSALMYLVPIVRRGRLARRNEVIRAEGLARRLYGRVLADPSRVDPREVRPVGGGMDPSRFEAVRKRIFDRFAGAKGAEPEALPDGRLRLPVRRHRARTGRPRAVPGFDRPREARDRTHGLRLGEVTRGGARALLCRRNRIRLRSAISSQEGSAEVEP